MRGRGLNACSVVIKKYRTVCCSVKTNKGRLVRAAGGCGEGFGACESGCRCAGVCTRVSKNRGRVLAKTNLRRRKSGRSLRRGDAVAVVGYREVVKREFARENPSPFRPSSGVRGSSSVSLYRPRNRAQNKMLLIFVRNWKDMSCDAHYNPSYKNRYINICVRYLKIERMIYEIKNRNRVRISYEMFIFLL